MKIAIIGLGKIGYQIAVKLQSAGHEVIGYDTNPDQLKVVSEKIPNAADKREDVIAKFENEKPVIWLMIPAQAVGDEVNAWASLLPSGSIIVDGGNTKFSETVERAETLNEKGIMLVDVGTSGGVLGLENGFSFMVGGEKEAFEKVSPILDSLSKPSGGYHHFGPSGSGHFIKMVHNAIEYGVMESLAEGYHFLEEAPFKGLDLAAIADVWQHGSIVESKLNGLIGQILKENPTLDGIDGVVASTGEAEWALAEAASHNIEMPAVAAALGVRNKSQSGNISFSTKLLATLRNKFGGHKINPK